MGQSCTQEPPLQNTDWAKYNLKGAVKSIEEASYYVIVKDGAILKGAKEENSFSKQILFNRKGKVTFYNTFEGDGSLYLQNRYQYSDDGVLRKISIFKLAERYMGKDTFIYNDKGLLLEKISLSSKDSINNKEVYQYNTEGKVSQFQLYSFKGNLLTTIQYQYNKQGLKEKITEFYPDGSLNRMRIYRYDAAGNEISSHWINADNSFFAKWHYKYDQYKNQTEKLTLDEKDKVSIKREYHYKYDKEDNWTEQIKYENGVPKLITLLKIEYY